MINGDLLVGGGNEIIVNGEYSIYITWLIIHWFMDSNVLYRACFIYLLALELVKERKN